jgi:hypothetical protein
MDDSFSKQIKNNDKNLLKLKLNLSGEDKFSLNMNLNVIDYTPIVQLSTNTLLGELKVNKFFFNIFYSLIKIYSIILN